MSLKTGPDERRQFYERHLQGETYGEIAESAGVSVGCVRYWCRRLRQNGSCLSHYHRDGSGLRGHFEVRVRTAIVELRRQHPRWGPSRIRFRLAQLPEIKRERLRLPSLTQIGRYLGQWPDLKRRLRTAPAVHVRPSQPQRVGQRWQIDFKMGLALRDGSQVNLPTVRDPLGEVCIASRVTPAGQVGRKPPRVSVAELQDTLPSGFARWHTLPEEVQTDNEPVFVGDTDDAFPGVFTLWLAGLGIRHLTTRPGTPTDNAEIERCHQTICNYAIVGHEEGPCPARQQELDQALEELAFDLPSHAEGCHGLPPVQAHPELLQPSRLFSAEQEWERFDLAAVDSYLASGGWQRRVGQTGQVCIGGHHHYYTVGRAYAGRTVYVCFDQDDRHFVFFDPQQPEVEIRRQPARHLDTESLTGLQDPNGQAWPQQLRLFNFAYTKG